MQLTDRAPSRTTIDPAWIVEYIRRAAIPADGPVRDQEELNLYRVASCTRDVMARQDNPEHDVARNTGQVKKRRNER